MRLQLTADSRVTIELRAAGLLRAVGHEPTLVAAPEPMVLEVMQAAVPSQPIEVALDVVFRVDRIDPPADIGRSDRDRMRDNLRGAEVLDAKRFPTLSLHGSYRGSFEQGRLEGDLVIRGARKPVEFDVRIARAGGRLVATGTWEGRLTELGIRPFRALMGALRLDDFLRLRVEASFDEPR